MIYSQTLPPLIRKQPGRPHTKRYRKGQWSRKQKQCGNCLDWGHSRRTSRRQPVPSGRNERSRDWFAEIVDIIASDEGSEEGSDDSSGTEGGTEDVIEVELCDELGELHDDLFNDSDYYFCGYITRIPLHKKNVVCYVSK
jgi:hypothetical protein